jgi:hypothetical protein
MKHLVSIALTLGIATPAFAQQPPLVADKRPLVANSAPLDARAAETLDPARVTAARTLLDVVMPPAKRDGMIDSMMRGMMANLSQAMLGSPQMKAAFEADPRAGEIFQKFFQRQQANSLTALKANFPGMMEAMARAYARRFTVTQMGEMRTFFETPTGQVYIGQAATIVNDPDVAKWQRDLMTKEMGKMPAEIEAMMAEIKALPPKGKTGG